LGLAGLIVGLVVSLGAEAAPTKLLCGKDLPKVREKGRTQLQKRLLLQRRGQPRPDHHHRFRVCRRAKVGPPPPNEPPPSGAPDPNGGPGGNWDLKFRDEFSGTSLDTSKWFENNSAGTSHYGPQGGTAYKPGQVRVHDGRADLHLTPSPFAGQPYSGVRIDTMGKFEYTRGYAEARWQLGKQPLNWAAFWTNGHNWPEDGEVDVFETLGSNLNPVAHVHTPAGGPGAGGKVIGNAGTTWHTYAAHWEANKITFYYDGQAVGSWNGSINSPHHLILSMQGPYAGTANVGDFASVDYVRVWQR
jgi:hypothetical protein